MGKPYRTETTQQNKKHRFPSTPLLLLSPSLPPPPLSLTLSRSLSLLPLSNASHFVSGFVITPDQRWDLQELTVNGRIILLTRVGVDQRERKREYRQARTGVISIPTIFLSLTPEPLPERQALVTGRQCV